MSKILLLTFALAVLFNTQDVKKDLPTETEFVTVEIIPEMIYQEEPVYPKKAEKANIEGTVYIKALIDSEGKIAKVKVGKSSGHDLLDKSAVAAAYKCKFKPAVQKDKPVATWISYKVEFNLGDCNETEK